MHHKNLLLFFFVFTLTSLHSQIPKDFGLLKNSELNFTTYEKDKSANAVVLFEKGENYFTIVDQRTILRKKYHVKIKILNEKAYDLASVSIPLYFNDEAEEKITHLKAKTHNQLNTLEVTSDKIFTNDLSENWKEKTFTFPDLKPGSILEYAYTIETPFYFNFTDWYFQQEIPVIYSEFNALIPGNWKYNQAIYGDLELTSKEVSLKENCFLTASCESYKYILKDVPAFKEGQKYMLARSNYISRIEFELAEYKSVADGYRYKYSKTWKDVDREFRKEKDIGKQLSKKGFFEKNIPENLLTKGNQLEKAQNIYSFIRNHYSWNEKFGIYKKARVKDAFNKKSGSVSEINISLINLLNAAGIKTDLVLLSTRKNGLPKKIYPVITDFNYCIAKAEIDGENYLLDATDKDMPFGMLPFRVLNRYGRVMDFENDSYWYDIVPEKKNRSQIRAQLKFDTKENIGIGVLDLFSFGHNAVTKRKQLNRYSEEEDYTQTYEENVEGEFVITAYDHKKEQSTPKKVLERFEFQLEDPLNGDKVYLNPFLFRFFKTSPFTLSQRNYPVDFGYPRSFKYNINIEVPEDYEVIEMPENKALQLGNRMVVLKFLLQERSGTIAVTFDLDINATQIQPVDYEGLKNLFKEVTNIQNNSLLVFKKKRV